MLYNSTRNINGGGVTGAEAVLSGIAPDGGLFVPQELPNLITPQYIRVVCQLPYHDRAAAILKQFFPELSENLTRACGESYGDGFAGGGDITQVVPLGGNRYVLELWHGPTCAFKDMALQILPRLLTLSDRKYGKGAGHTTAILTATSGDTGKAALEGFRDVPGTKIMVFYPENGVSAMQRRQMITQEGGNVSVVAVKGNFDDCQNGVKAIFGDTGLASELAAANIAFSSANSINWGRLAPQIVYYISAYADLVSRRHIKNGDIINVCVPTGNFGNIQAAYYAKKMGLPIGKLICASNVNNVLTDFLSTGTYDRNREFYTTTSPSMDILISSNLERLLYHLSDNDGAHIAYYFDELKKTGKFTVSKQILSRIKEDFTAGCADDEEGAAAIRAAFERAGYLADTHTAIALAVGARYQDKYARDNSPMLIASTASPFKFPASVLRAIKGEAEQSGETSDEYEAALALSSLSHLPVPDALLATKTKPVRFEESVEVSGMSRAVREFLLK